MTNKNVLTAKIDENIERLMTSIGVMLLENLGEQLAIPTGDVRELIGSGRLTDGQRHLIWEQGAELGILVCERDNPARDLIFTHDLSKDITAAQVRRLHREVKAKTGG